MVNYILSDAWERDHKGSTSENKRVITAVANLILNEVKCMDASSENYPIVETINMIRNCVLTTTAKIFH